MNRTRLLTGIAMILFPSPLLAQPSQEQPSPEQRPAPPQDHLHEQAEEEIVVTAPFVRELDLLAGTCACPGGQQSRDFWPRPGGGGLFRFAADVCAACPLRAQRLKGRGGRGVRIHPQEGLLQAARAEQASPAGREHRTRRQAVEHRIARLVQLGIRQARYIGRTKTLFQLLVAAAVANLTRLANAAGEPRRAPDDLLGAAMRLASALVGTLVATCSPAPYVRPSIGNGCWQPLPPPTATKMPGCRPGF